MGRNLDELEDFLWQEFDAARERQKKFTEWDNSVQSTDKRPGNYATENRHAVAAVAEAIVAVRREKRVEKFGHDQQKIEDEIENGTRRDVAINPPLKIKP